MMSEFDFDLQRFNWESVTLGGSSIDVEREKVFSVGGDSITLTAGTNNSIAVSLLVDESNNSTTHAVISLSSANEEFKFNGNTYKLNGKGADGVAVSISSAKDVTVGHLDKGDIFVLGDETISMTDKGLLTGSTNSYDRIILDSNLSSIALTNSTINHDAWYKILNVDNENDVSIDSASFSLTGYKGAIAAHTNGSSLNMYAYLPTVSSGESPQIRYFDGVNATLSKINLATDILDGGVIFTPNFAGSGTAAPSISTDLATLHVDQAKSYFSLAGVKDSNSIKSVSLDGSAELVHLIKGSLVTAADSQSITAGNYTLHSYSDTNGKNDGIIIFTGNDGNINLNDLDSGESFYISGGSGSSTIDGTYTMTNMGLVNSDGVLLVKDENFSGRFGPQIALSVSDLVSVVNKSENTLKPIDAREEVVSLSANSKASTVIVSYGTDAWATLFGDARNQYTLSTDSNAKELHLGSWQGIYLDEGSTVSLSSAFIDANDPLKITTPHNTFALAKLGDESIAGISLAGGTATLDFINKSLVSDINFTSGNLIVRPIQNVTLPGSDDILLKNTATNYAATLLASTNDYGNEVTLFGSNGYADYDVGRGHFGPNSTVKIDSVGNTQFTLSNVSSLGMANATINSYAYSTIKGSVTFIYGKDEGVSVTNLDNGDSFKSQVTLNGVGQSHNYSVVGGNRLKDSYTIGSGRDTTIQTRIWTSDGNSNVSRNSIVDLDDSNFDQYIISSDGMITLASNGYKVRSSGNTWGSVEEGNDILIVSSEELNSYGTLKKLSDTDRTGITNYELTKNTTSDTESITSVHITDSSVVKFDENFSGTTVSVGAVNSTTMTGFQVMSNDSLTVERTDGIVNVSNATKLSLISGTLRTDESNQTILANNYSISADPNSDNPDGITVEISVRGSNKTAIIRDIDIDESFYVDGQKYTRGNLGLTSVSLLPDGKSSIGLYYYGLYTDPTIDATNPDETLGVDVASLNNMTILTASESIDVGGEVKYVFEIGTKNKVGALVVDQLDPPTTRQANFVTHGSNTYELSAVDGSSIPPWSMLDIVSLTGGNTTINSSLVSGKTIIAAGSSAAFKVTSANNGNFVVSGRVSKAAVEGANALTLLNGTIAAAQNQTVTLGEDGKSFSPVSKNDIVLAYGENDSAATIWGETSDRFSISGGDYSVKSGKLEAIVDNSDVTLSALTYSGGDVFVYNNDTYSLRAAGLVRQKRRDNATIKGFWYYDGSHYLDGDSVKISDLEDDDNWNALQAISNNTATINGTIDNTTFIDGDNNNDGNGGFQKTYGSLIEIGNSNVYSLTKSADEGLLSGLYISDNSVNGVYLSNEFSKMSITAPNAAVKVTGLESGKDNYLVTLYGGTYAGVMGLSGVTNASLISGSLKADNNIEVVIGGNYIQAGESATITLAGTNVNNASIVGLDTGESFSINGSAYVLGAIGLVNDNDQLLENFTLASYGRSEKIRLSTILSGDATWRDLIAPQDNVLLIENKDSLDNVLVVDKLPEPTARYAKITKVDTGGFTGFSLELDTASSWPTTEIIRIDNTSVSLASDFQNRTIEGANSGATFKITDNNNSAFTVTDRSEYTSIKGARNITQTNGTIATNTTNQTITASGHKISFSDGDSIKVVVGGDSASIAALNQDDVFTVGGKTYSMASDQKLKANGKLWTDYILESVVAVDALEDANNWSNIIDTNGKLTIDASTATVLGDDGDSALVINDSDVDIVYGTLKLINGGYSLSTVGASKNTSLTGITIGDNDNPVSLTSGFKNIPITAGKTTFQVTSTEEVFSIDYGSYVEIDNASKILLTAGTLKTTSEDQTITADEYAIHGISFGSDSAITVMKSGNIIQVGALDVGEIFGIGNYTYTFTDVGVIRSNPSSTVRAIANDDGYSDSGLYTVGTSFDRDVIGVSMKELDLSKQANSALVVNDLDKPTKRLAEVSTITNGFSIKSDYPDSITSIYLGNKDVALSSNFDTSVRTDAGTHTFTVNGSAYKAAGVELTIQSGAANNESSLVKGAVILNTLTSSVRTATNNSITANAGNGITVTASDSSAVTISSLNKGDQFSVDGTSYSVTGAGLTTTDKIWTPDSYDSVIVANTGDNALNNDGNWGYIVAVSDSVLAIPPEGYPSSVNSWIILSEDRNSNFGTLNKSENGYSIVPSNTPWGNDTISINGVSVAFPADFRNKNISGVDSRATFKITDNTNFNVNDGADGATITGATKISQTGGTIALIDTNQVVATSDSHSVVAGNMGNGITVIIGTGGAASIGALNIRDTQDSFIVDGITYEMLRNGSIQRKDNSRYWTHSIFTDNATLGISDLQNDNYWGGYIAIKDGALKIGKNTLGDLTTAFVIDETDATKIYGTLIKGDSSYTLSDATATDSLNSIEVSTEAQPVSLTANYVDIPITAGDTQFKATKANNGYTINYTDDNLSVDDATALTLIKGEWTLTDTNQTLTANRQMVQVGGASSSISITYDGTTNGNINVTGIDAAGEIAKINGETYQLTAGNGISVSLTSAGVATVNGISDEDDFTIADNRFIKKEPGFIKSTSRNNFLWINDTDVTTGVAVESLGSDAETNWAAVATVSNDNVIISKNSKDAILIDNVTGLSKIYGTLGLYDSGYTLTKGKSNTLPSSISVKDTLSTLESYFMTVPISAAGASFIVNSVTSGNEFIVDARESNPVLGNAAEVSLTSGTLADLTSETTVKTDSGSIAAQSNSIINVGFNGSEITIGELEDSEGFTLGKNSYVYKNVGVVKGGNALYANSSLNGTVTDTILNDADLFQTMFASDGSTLTLQSKANGIFVDSASNSVSEVYAAQNYDGSTRTYTFTQIEVDDYTIDAASLASGGIVNVPFTGTVITPSTGNFTINDKPYTAVSELIVDTTKNSSTLNKGTVSLAKDGTVEITGIDDNVSVTSGNGIEVTAENGTYTLGSLDKNDIFTIGGYSYTMKSDVFIVREDSAGKEEIYTASITGGTLSKDIIDESDYWNSFIYLESNGTLNLSSTVKGGTVISSDFTEMYANLTVNNKTYYLNQLDGADTSGIVSINLSNENSTLSTDFEATVKTASGSNTYTVNDNSYTAKDSSLEISATERSSTITKGVITLNNSTVATTSNHTVTGSVSELNVASMKFTPVSGETFNLDGTSYKMTDLGLTKGDNSIWTRASDDSYTLPDEDAWSNMLRLTKTGTLNLRNDAEEGSTVIIDYDATKRMALLTRSDNTYSLNAVNNNSISSIQLGNSTDDTLTFTLDFDSDVSTGNGIYKINGNIYKGNSLTIKAEDGGSALYSGTVNLYDDDSVTDYENGYTVEATDGDGITVTATNGTITTLGNLNRGDTFTIDNKYYKVLGNETLIQIDVDGNPSKLYENLISGSSLRYSDIVNDDNFVAFVKLEDGVLDLTTRRGEDGWSAIVLAEDNNSDPTIRIAKVSYTDDGGYKLETTSGGDLSNLTSVKLGSAVKTFSTDLDITVNTTATGTPYTINGKNFTPQDNLTISVADNNAILTDGTITLAENGEVTTRRINNGIQTDEEIKATSGSITVNVDDSTGTVTIGGLNAGEKFNVDGIEYTMTNIGLQNGTLINASVADTASVTTVDLSGSDWLTILPITDGILNLTASTASNVLVVDVSSPTRAVRCGTLLKSGDTYTLTQRNSDSKLSGITITGTKVILGTMATDVDITANGNATFSVTATGNFTINAATTDAPPIISDVTGIYLTAGTIQAPADIPVTANGKTITATNGDMLIGFDSNGKVVVSELDTEDEFTADGIDYQMTTAGLIDITDLSNRRIVTAGVSEDLTSFIVDDVVLMRIIAVDSDGTLNLSDALSGNSVVVNNIDNPIAKYGTLNKNGNTYTLYREGNSNGIKFVTMPAVNSTLTTDISVEINTPSGSNTFTVNGKEYAANNSALVIKSDGTTSTLTDGKISLVEEDDTVTTTSGSTVTYTANGDGMTIEVTTSGTITFDDLTSGDNFTINGNPYKVTAVAPMNPNGEIWTGSDYTSGITLAAINNAANWTPLLVAANGNLSVNADTLSNGEEVVIVDDNDNPTKIYGILSKSRTGNYTLNHPDTTNGELSSITLSNANLNLASDFAGTDITANSANFTVTATDNFTINATSTNPVINNATAVNLNAGTIQAPEDVPITADSRVIMATDGDMTVGFDSNNKIVVGVLDSGDTFTVDDIKYQRTTAGLIDITNTSAVRMVTMGLSDDLTSFTIDDVTLSRIIAVNSVGVLNLSDAPAGSAIVVNNLNDPTTNYGTLVKNGNNYTLTKGADEGITAVTMPDVNSTITTDIVTAVNTPSSSNTFIVNRKEYTAADSALTIASDGTTSTLTDGKVSLVEENDSVTTTSGFTVTYTADDDGMTVEADSSGTVTIGELNLGDTFKIGDTSYRVSSVGPINSEGKLWNGNDYTEGITVEAINDGNNWTPMLVLTNENLSVNADTLADGDEFVLVDDISNPTEVYGSLLKTDGKYTLANHSSANAEFNSISARGIVIEIAPEFADIDLIANTSNRFSDVTLNDITQTFTLDASGDTAILSDNVGSLTLESGSITAGTAQTVTTGDTTITPTVINNTMIIGMTAVSGIVEGDEFTLDEKVYKMLNTGLFNDSDNTLVTSGMANGELIFDSIVETQLIEVSAAGALDLSNAEGGNSIVVDTVESPSNIYGTLDKDEEVYTLNKQGKADGIKSVTMPDTDSTLVTDIVAEIDTPQSSNTFTINRRDYTADNSALMIESDGSTSTLTDGKISLVDKNDTVTTTSGSTITYTVDGDGMTVQARKNSTVMLDGLTSGDTFKIGNDSYKVTDLGFHNADNYLWTSNANYARGVAISDAGNDGINNASNWTKTVAAEDENLSVKANTLDDGDRVIIVDSVENSTKTLGTLSRTSDTYTLTKDADDDELLSIAIDDTKLTIDRELADVPITANRATFTVTTEDNFTVDATGDIVSISEDATAIEISRGTVSATTKQTVTATSNSGNTNVVAQGNGTFDIGGEEFKVADNKDDITFGMTNGVPNSVSGLEESAKVTIDGITYTAPQDDSILRFNDTDGWYFDGYIPTGKKYNITIDGNGNIILDPGVKFTDVVASGKTLPADGTIKLAADVNSVAVNVTNNGSTSIAINDKDNNPLVENLGRVSNLTFDNAGAMVERTSDVAGAIFTFDVGRSLETETATITSNANNCEVGVGTNGTSLSVDKSATIEAPANTLLTLGNADYNVNGVDFSTSGTAQASVTSGGVKIDLVLSDPITYDETGLNGTGTATAGIDKYGRISLTSGASVNGAAGKALNLSGTITLDANTIEAATATDVTAKANGLTVGDDDMTVTGDEDGYKVNIVEGKISGLENIGNSNGVTIGGLSNGTIKTDRVGSFTVADRTFTAVDDASVTYGIEGGKISYVNDVDRIISGDFSDGLEVNGGDIQVTGENVSLRADTDDDRRISGMRTNATLTTAEGVTKVIPTGAGKFTFGDHVFETTDRTIAFNLLNSSVTGIESLQSGTLIISQDENNLRVNSTTLALTDIDSQVTLGIASSKIDSVYGLDGGITGLDNATVFGLSSATINGKFFDIDGDEVNAVVISGEVPDLFGLDNGATVNSAPNVNVRTNTNGTFVFRDDKYEINDTLDGVVVFTTNINSYVTNIGELEGSISGNLEEINLNDKPFNSSSDKVTVVNDGEDVIAIYGLSSGDTISGSLSSATYIVPKGTLTVNDQNFVLKGDEDGVSVSGDGKVILGLDRNASLTVAKGGDFSVNSDIFDDAADGTTFIAGRDHVYIYDPNNKPITDITEIDDIIKNLIGDPDPGTIKIGGDSAAEYIKSGDLNRPMEITLDNSGGSSVQDADFSNSSYSKRITLLGGDQDVKFNDEGKNAAYVAPTANGKKNIQLGDGGDVAVNDSPYARVSIKAGKGEDTIVNRKGASSTVDVENNGDTTIVPTSGRVTLQNYDNNNHAKIRTFEYTDLTGAIKDNSIKFGDGLMTLGDAVVVFDPDASEKGGTFANLVDYSGKEQRVGFTHTDGGVLNASTSGDDLILKGNYAEKSSDTTKSGASTLIGGRGDDIILAGEGDYVRAGAGDNQIYLTDKNLRGTDGATILLGDRGRNTIHNFNDGYDDGDVIRISDLSDIKFYYETEDGEGLVMRSGNARITFDGLEPAEELVSYEDSDTAEPYEIKITDGKKEYNIAVAQEERDIGVNDYSEADVFFGDKNGGSGLNFSEYSGPVEVNLNLDAGRLSGADVQAFNINKLQAGDGNSTLIGKAGANNTLIAGKGDGSMWSAAGRDLMVGNSSDEKDGSTMFYYMAGDGRDTITDFTYLTSENDYNADIISLPAGNIVTNVLMSDDDIVMVINESRNDYLRLQEAVGKDFKLNDRVARVDTNGVFDNLADFYVVAARNATMNIGANVGDAQVWLDDRITGEHGVIYKGEIKYLNASTANGNTTLVGNDLDNVIYGGTASNSIWGGFGANNDTLIGGSGHNTFFFGLENGRDTITSINAGDIVYLANGIEQIASTTITSGGTKIELIDGSSLEIQGNAKDVEYHLSDGSKYSADHSTKQWIEK